MLVSIIHLAIAKTALLTVYLETVSISSTQTGESAKGVRSANCLLAVEFSSTHTGIILFSRYIFKSSALYKALVRLAKPV